MNRDEFAQLQQEGSLQDLAALAMRCRERYLRSADLVGEHGPVIEALRDFGIGDRIDATTLLPAWTVVCGRYRVDRFDPQLDLFKDHDSEARQAWQRFVYWLLFPALVRHDECVRNVLRALGILPCQAPDAAVEALRHHLTEMELPTEPLRLAREENHV